MKNILIAGATGYLGSHLVKELQNRHYPFRALGRNEGKLKTLGLTADQRTVAEVTHPESLKNALTGIQVVISTVGITRQKDGLSYLDVDYRGNRNLLEAARKAGVKKFIYVSAISGDRLRHLKIMEAKEKFVDELKTSGMDYAIIRPNGFFSDMNDFLSMAQRGKVYLFGSGEYKFNPIHGADLAEAIVDAVPTNEREIIIGGPDVLTQNEVAEMALIAWKRPHNVLHFPDWSRKLLLAVLHTFTSPKFYGPYEFFLTMMAQDNIAPRFGSRRLASYFLQEVNRLPPEN
ncbi:SDR family oxidoreductase [Lewinella sp. W8]|uniref:SDR family oxidoreductase n=1 Tax=Lewinella sp. W8 TaxID=2528208 RepID=UPI00106842A4|nr:SDR family oxidoreductase [Lewinella sp. W8]MTB51019.1 NAD(P)H-binding protein [Lewinella sp. W8]